MNYLITQKSNEDKLLQSINHNLTSTKKNISIDISNLQYIQLFDSCKHFYYVHVLTFPRTTTALSKTFIFTS